MNRAQIAYDQQSEPLSEEVESSIRSKLSVMLKKLDFRGRFLSILFCSAETMQKLNAEHRGMDKPADILSWLYGEEEEDNFGSADDRPPWGELAVCLQISRKQSLNSGWSHETEILRLLAHGLGHLMGYDHELSEVEEAKALEFESGLLSLIGLEKIYS